MRTLSEIMKTMPAKRRAKIERKAKEIIAEVDSLAALRGVPGVSQENLAKAMGVSQPVVSRMERQSDLLLSTLRGYVAALGGSLDLVVHFPGVGSVRLASFSDVFLQEPEGAAEIGKRALNRRQRRARTTGFDVTGSPSSGRSLES